MFPKAKVIQMIPKRRKKILRTCAVCLLLLLAGGVAAAKFWQVPMPKSATVSSGSKRLKAFITAKSVAALKMAPRTAGALPGIPNLSWTQSSIPGKAASLPENHPIKGIYHCLKKFTNVSKLAPASYEAYTQHGELPRLMPLELWHSLKQLPRQILTVVSSVTYERLDMLQAQCESWPGPLAAVLYMPVVDESEAVAQPGVLSETQWAAIQPAYTAMQDLVMQMEAGKGSCALTVMLVYEHVKPDMAHQLPINALRNQGLLLSHTPLVAMLDIDLMVSSSLAYTLEDPPMSMEMLRLLLGQKAFMVLPAFEASKMASNRTHTKMDDQLTSRREVASLASKSEKKVLQELMRQGVIEIFNSRHNRPGHWETDFKTWFSCLESPCKSYTISPKAPRFEPWGVLDRKLALDHLYDESFRGYGGNKIANIMLLQAHNISMLVHGNGFVVHRPHAASQALKAWVGEHDLNLGQVPLNTKKLEYVQTAIQQGTYAPKVAAVTAACAAWIQQL